MGRVLLAENIFCLGMIRRLLFSGPLATVGLAGFVLVRGAPTRHRQGNKLTLIGRGLLKSEIMTAVIERKVVVNRKKHEHSVWGRKAMAEHVRHVDFRIVGV